MSIEGGVGSAAQQRPRRSDASPRRRRRRRDRTRSHPTAAIGRVLAVLILGALLVLLVHLRAWPPFAIVMSDSMAPTMEVGSVVVLRSVRDTPQLGDIVAVEVPGEIQSRFNYPSEVVHRIVEVTDEGNFHTSGDNRAEVDPFVVPPGAVSTEVAWVLPGVGAMLAFVMSPFGLLWLGLGVVLFIILPLYDFQKERMEVERVELASLDRLSRELGEIKEVGSAAASPVIQEELDDVRDTLGELVGAVGEYGHHLRSHTAILKSMSEAARELAVVTAELKQQLASGTVVRNGPISETSSHGDGEGDEPRDDPL